MTWVPSHPTSKGLLYLNEAARAFAGEEGGIGGGLGGLGVGGGEAGALPSGWFFPKPAAGLVAAAVLAMFL